MKKTKTLLKGVAALIALPLLIALAGCSSTAGIQGSSAMMTDSSGDIEHSEYVIVNNPKVARGLQIVDMATKRIGNMLQASITLVSKYSDTEEYQYKFAWFDADGFELDPEGNAWIPFIMYGNETKTIQGVSPNPSARQFKINLRLRN
ncbi:MAG: YcfL family protein [Candidatus Auribacterota bacterium]|nr:YcfL family protein [Candidatus Auribacterota bacterium]